MDNTEDIKQYFKKLQKVVNGHAEFSLFGKKLIKKEKIDDILCCLLAVFPDKYKSALKHRVQGNLKSVTLYNAMFKYVKGNFPLNKSVYLVDTKKTTDLISAILKCIGADIKHIENAQ